MKAYEFETKINKGIVKIPSNYLNEIEKGRKVRVIILTEEAKPMPTNKKEKSKLSSFLLLSELEENEFLFERNDDTGRDISL